MMRICPDCNYEFEHDHPLPAFCPGCASALERECTDSDSGEEYDSWISIARFTNLAEVGFFADMLSEFHITSHVRNHDEFSAVDGSWQTSFFLQVPPDRATHAADLLKQEITQSEKEPFYLEHEKFDGNQYSDFDSYQQLEKTQSERRIEQGVLTKLNAGWKPTVVFLFVGSMIYYVGNEVGIQRAGVIGDKPTLWEVLSETDSPLETDSAPGIPRRRVKFSSDSETVLIEDDHDGDGNFDEQRLFRKGKLIRQHQAVR